ncbi:haloacid dehalogenase-like family hydrolase, putative [Babesia ovis]|uniref:Haloacid dehalogenase-like family hydrolase, putative n=1 Tax=Babesia ovis TaxID=5869 RepID=A0A9W5WW55_BABOV|nr:haloacid dehalogenase-like family hydrolase, putative [Babesia ovis]
MYICGVLAPRIRLARAVYSSASDALTRSCYTLSTGTDNTLSTGSRNYATVLDTLEALSSAKTRAEVSRVLESTKWNASKDRRNLPSSEGSYGVVSGGRHQLSGAIEHNLWSSAVCNAIRRRCTDLTVWSLLDELLPTTPLGTGDVRAIKGGHIQSGCTTASVVCADDLPSINRVLYRLSRFECGNSVKLKVDAIASKLLQRVRDLVQQEIDRGIIDLKVEVQRRGISNTKLDSHTTSTTNSSSVDNSTTKSSTTNSIHTSSTHDSNTVRIPASTTTNTSTPSTAIPNTTTSTTGPGEVHTDNGTGINLGIYHLDYEQIWRLWYLLASGSGVKCHETSQLLLELLDRRKREMYRFDLGRVLRTMGAILGQRQRYSLLEERVLIKLYSRMVSLLGSNLSVTKTGDDSTTSGVDNGKLLVRQGNLYLTTNHIRDSIQVISVMCRKMPPVSFLPMLSSDSSVDGLLTLFNVSKVVIEREVALQKRVHEVATGGDTTSILESPSHMVKVLKYSVDFLKHLDLITRKGLYPTLSKLRQPVYDISILCFASPLRDNLRMNAQLLVAGYYLVLSMAVNGQCCVEYIDRILTCTRDLLNNIISNGPIDGTVLNKDTLGRDIIDNRMDTAKDFIQLFMQVDKLASLVRDLGVSSPVAIDINQAFCENLKQQVVVFNRLVEDGISNCGFEAVMLHLFQKHNLLALSMVYSFLEKLTQTSTQWSSWEPRNVSIVCDVVSRWVMNSCASLYCDESVSIPGYTVETLNNNNYVSSVYSTVHFDTGTIGRLLASTISSCTQMVNSDATFNNEQLLSVARCFVVVNKTLCDSLEKTILYRCTSMNISESLKCLSLGSVTLEAKALDRIQWLLKRNRRVMDITPVLDFVCIHSGQEPSMTRWLTLPVDPSVVQRLQELLAAVDMSEVLVLNDMEYLQRRLEKQMNHFINRHLPTDGSHTTSSQAETHIIASRRSMERYQHLIV